MLVTFAVAIASFVLGVLLAGGAAAVVIGILYRQAERMVDEYVLSAARHPVTASPRGRRNWRPRIVAGGADD